MPDTSFAFQFVADATLGKLARHLRLAGFDTYLDLQPPQPERLSGMAGSDRILLTRSGKVRRALGATSLIFIQANDLPDQFRQVMTTLGLTPDDLRPLTRCALCNRMLDRLSKPEALGRVPDYVWQQYSEFKTCPQCRRVYWPGSHVQRWRDQTIRWFGGKP
jgi:hypothetical protein